jgi:hypothetical protein
MNLQQIAIYQKQGWAQSSIIDLKKKSHQLLAITNTNEITSPINQ